MKHLNTSLYANAIGACIYPSHDRIGHVETGFQLNLQRETLLRFVVEGLSQT